MAALDKPDDGSAVVSVNNIVHKYKAYSGLNLSYKCNLKKRKEKYNIAWLCRTVAYQYFCLNHLTTEFIIYYEKHTYVIGKYWSINATKRNDRFLCKLDQYSKEGFLRLYAILSFHTLFSSCSSHVSNIFVVP